MHAPHNLGSNQFKIQNNNLRILSANLVNLNPNANKSSQKLQENNNINEFQKKILLNKNKIQKSKSPPNLEIDPKKSPPLVKNLLILKGGKLKSRSPPTEL